VICTPVLVIGHIHATTPTCALHVPFAAATVLKICACIPPVPQVEKGKDNRWHAGKPEGSWSIFCAVQDLTRGNSAPPF